MSVFGGYKVGDEESPIGVTLDGWVVVGIPYTKVMSLREESFAALRYDKTIRAPSFILQRESSVLVGSQSLTARRARDWLKIREKTETVLTWCHRPSYECPTGLDTYIF